MSDVNIARNNRTTLKGFFKSVIIGLALIFIMPLIYKGFARYVSAQDSPATPTPTAAIAVPSSTIDDLNKKIAEYKNKIATKQTEAASLSKEIGLIENNIDLKTAQILQARLQITAKEDELTTLQEDIRLMEIRLSRLDGTIDYHEKLLEQRLKEEYIDRQTSFLEVLMSSNGVGDFVSKLSYLRKIQNEDKNLLSKMNDTKGNYESQQELLKEKQDEVERIKAEIESKKNEMEKLKDGLAQQKQEKDNLLRVTKNDEKKYKQLLDEANAQLASFKEFSSTAGGSGIIDADSLGKGFDGNYFSQRDSRWGRETIGTSSRYTISEVGCLITDIAMVLKSQGVNVTPSSIANTNSYFVPGTAYMLNRSGLSFPGQKKDTYIAHDVLTINSQLKKGNSVIVGLKYGKYGTHFIVLKKEVGDTWMIYDPWYGPDLKFNQRYTTRQIYSAEIIT